MDELIQQLKSRIEIAASSGTKLRVKGGGSKDFYGGALQGEVLDVGGYSGIVDYEPKELVLTVRAGTPLAEVERLVAAEGQMLPFEPPHFGLGATIGGTVACGFSGPRRAYAGAVRDFVLGARILDGKGQDLRFGGRVIKNVAGYDVSRLMVGALGTLGVLLDISFKVLPRPAAETTLRFEMDQARAIQEMNHWAGQPLPLSASAWLDGLLTIRLSGAAAGVAAARAKLGGEEVPSESQFWEGLREHRLPFFATPDLRRVSLPATSSPLQLNGPVLVEWGGAQRWVNGHDDIAALRATVEKLGGHVTQVRGDRDKPKAGGVFHPLPAGLAAIHRRLKATFDPHGILNVGRMDNF
jgi:glycolate oxidase FAD binding subunit